MKKIIAAAVLGFGTLAASSGAFAAPATGLGSLPQLAPDGNIERVHGVHRSCERGPAGWHRSPGRGVRIACRPSRPSGLHWLWRCADGKCGYWHRRDRRWN